MNVKIVAIILALQFLAVDCFAKHIESLDYFEQLHFNRGVSPATINYNILSNATYTTDLVNYRFNDYIIQVANNHNPGQMSVRILETNNIPHTVKQPELPKLPWWNRTAPVLIKKLDFSMVDGDSVEYKIDKNYSLRILGRQGHWGKVYVLERLSSKNKPEIVCAVKLLLNRMDRNVEESEFHKRHHEEINSNFTVVNWDIAVKPYGIIENDQDHYLLFMEYGQSVKDRFENQKQDITIRQLITLINDVNNMHALGYAHGDLNLGNVLFIRGKLRLCDWYSLVNIKKITVEKYRYIGDNLPPEAIRAHYFDKHDGLNLKYALITDQLQERAYWLHPIAADRFSFGVSLLEIVAPPLHAKIDSIFKNLNPFEPESLEFWTKYAGNIREVQRDLQNMADHLVKTDKLRAKLMYQIIEYINLDPLKRLTIS